MMACAEDDHREARGGSARRAAARAHVAILATVRIGEREIGGRIVSMSSSGLLLRSDEPLVTGSTIRVLLDDPRVTQAIALEGVVLRSVGIASGVALVGIDTTTMSVLRQVVGRTTATGVISG